MPPAKATAALLFATLSLAHAQAPAAPPQRFEVASIRPHGGLLSRQKDFSLTGSRLRLEGYTLSQLIEEAFDLRSYQVSVKPPERGSADPFDTYYDIVAVTDSPNPTRNNVLAMLRTLLVERCGLATHTEVRELPIYAMVVAKSGPLFKASEPAAVRFGQHNVHGNNQTIEVKKESMPQLADELSIFVGDRTVIDKTGITGEYDIRFEATPAFRIQSDPQPEDLSVFKAIEQQLGLKLIPEKASVSVLVVDHIDPPTPN